MSKRIVDIYVRFNIFDDVNINGFIKIDIFFSTLKAISPMAFLPSFDKLVVPNELKVSLPRIVRKVQRSCCQIGRNIYPFLSNTFKGDFGVAPRSETVLVINF